MQPESQNARRDKWGRNTISRTYGCNFPETDERYHSTDLRRHMVPKQKLPKNITVKCIKARQTQGTAKSHRGMRQPIIQRAAATGPLTFQKASPSLQSPTALTPF